MVHITLAIGQFFTFLLGAIFSAAFSAIASVALVAAMLAGVGIGVRAIVLRRRK